MFVTVLDGVPSEVPALLLLVPITLASVLSSWRVGLPIALIAASVYGVLILPPIGTFHIGYTQEILIVVTFGAVAIVVSVLVSRRSIASRADLIGQQRMMLLRSVSHDLRNPLNSILGASTELYDGADYDEARAEAAPARRDRRDAPHRPDRRQPARPEPIAGRCARSSAGADVGE